MLGVAYLTLWERKVIGWMQVRIGPNRVTFFGIRGWAGSLQPIADGLKLLREGDHRSRPARTSSCSSWRR